jgi:hypothetical protein
MMKIIKKVLKYPCFCCNKSPNGKTVKRRKCTACGTTGKYKDEIYYHVIKTKSGKQIAFDGDTIK